MKFARLLLSLVMWLVIRSQCRSTEFVDESTRYLLTRNITSTNSKSPQVSPRQGSCLLMDRGSSRPYAVLIFLDTCFFDLFHNWYRHFVDVCGEERKYVLNVVCMDKTVSPLLNSLKLNCSLDSFVVPQYHQVSKRYAMIWTKRIHLIGKLLDSGMDVVLTDIDAIWRVDPFVYVNEHLPSSQIIGSRGNFPSTIYEKYGATLCMGFVYFQASIFSSVLLKGVLQEMVHDKADDQHAVNVVLDRWQIQWPRPLQVEHNTVADTGRVRVAGIYHNVTLLPHHLFVRNCTKATREHSREFTAETQATIARAVVAHCVMVTGNVYSKLQLLQTYRLWHSNVTMPSHSDSLARCHTNEEEVTQHRSDLKKRIAEQSHRTFVQNHSPKTLVESVNAKKVANKMKSALRDTVNASSDSKTVIDQGIPSNTEVRSHSHTINVAHGAAKGFQHSNPFVNRIENANIRNSAMGSNKNFPSSANVKKPMMNLPNFDGPQKTMIMSDAKEMTMRGKLPPSVRAHHHHHQQPIQRSEEQVREAS